MLPVEAKGLTRAGTGLPRVFRSRNDDIVNDDAGGIGTAPLKHEKAFWQNDVSCFVRSVKGAKGRDEMIKKRIIYCVIVRNNR